MIKNKNILSLDIVRTNNVFLLCYIFYVEYEEVFVGLYINGNNRPSYFAVLRKRAGRVYIDLNCLNEKDGMFFIYSNKKVASISVNGKLIETALNKEFDFEDEYLFCLVGGKNVYVGEKGSVYNRGVIIRHLVSLAQKYKQKSKELKELNFDIDYGVEMLINKMFNSARKPCFYERIKGQLDNIFNCFPRCADLEEIIHGAKFIKMSYLREDYFIGIIYRNNQTYAIGIGQKVNDKIIFKSDKNYQFIYDETNKNSGDSKCAYFFEFRNAFDGDIIFIK